MTDEIKNKIIELFCNTNMKLSLILKKVAPNNEITFEEMYNFISQYRTENGKMLTRPNNRKKFISYKDEIYELREKGLSYKDIAEYLNKKGIGISKNTVRNRCIEIYNENGKNVPSKTYKHQMEISDEELFELREKGMTYRQMMNYFDNKGIKISISTIDRRCKRIYELKGKIDKKSRENYDRRKETTKKNNPKQPERDKHKKMNTIQMYKEQLGEDIYELRNKGLSYREITDIFNEDHKKISFGAVRYICKQVYDEKGEKEPEYRHIKDTEVSDEEIFMLREQKMTFRAISEYYKEQGIDISYETIRKRCKEIYSTKGEKEPKIRRKKPREPEFKNRVFELRENGLSYVEIEKELRNDGEIITTNTISNICKEMYKERGKEEPNYQHRKKLELSEAEIYNLRQSGMSHQKIEQYYKEKGINVSYATIRKRCKAIYNARGEIEPNLKEKGAKEKSQNKPEFTKIKNQKVLIDAMLKVAEKKKATQEQLRIFAKEISKYYGKEIEFDFSNKQDKDDIEIR